MLLHDNKNKCTIYDKYFLDDLNPYTIRENNSSLSIDFKSDQRIVTQNIDISKSINKINTLSVTKPIKDIWYPAFISSSNSELNTKFLFRGVPSISDNIGIEQAVTFSPNFSSWNVSGSHSMNIDWILTAPLLSFIPKYGILFWYKESSLINQELSINNIPENAFIYPAQDYTYTDPDTSRTVSITKTTKLLKKTNSILYIIDNKNDIIVTNNSILPNTEYRVFDINKYLKSKKLNADNTKYKIVGSSLINNRTDLSIHISDGEAYSYWQSDETMEESYKSNICSQSYISPALYPIYREIYHILTLRYKKHIDKKIIDDKINIVYQPFFTIEQNRLFKKLAYMLSTFPLMDRTTISILDSNEIFILINEYINSKVKTLNEEQSLLYNILVSISKRFINLSKDYRSDNYSPIISNNSINNKTDLFNKLLFKYGSYLRLTGDSTITYKSGLANGPHVKINQDVISKCSFNLKNDIVFNNVVFNVGQFTAESSISRDNSQFLIKNKNVPGNVVTVPLYDITKKKLMLRQIGVTAGPDVEIDYDTLAKPKNETDDQASEISYDLNQAVLDFGDRGDLSVLGAEEPEVLWTKISGSDCLRFSNFALSAIDSSTGPGTVSSGSGSRYATSNDYNPTIYVKKPGKYVLQLRVKASFGVVYDIVTIHVNKQGVYTRSEPLRPPTYKSLNPVNGLTIILPNIRECAFGKQGVFWPIYSDCSIELPQVRSIPLIQPFGGPLNKIAIPMQADDKGNKQIQNGNVPLSITYRCNNTVVDLTRIILKNMMDATEECYQCDSLYEGILDDSGFYIDNNYTLLLIDPIDRTIKDIAGPNGLTTERSIIKAYGGFDKKTIDDLKINIPGHPEPGIILQSFSTTTGNFLEEPQKDGKVTYVCHETILPVDNKMSFIKGCFHPYSGWIDTNSHTHLKNKSSVLKFAPSYRPTQSFKGLGFDELRNEFLDGQAIIYKSSIELSVNEAAHDFVPPKSAKPEDLPRLLKEHDKQELSDHSNNYGYRSINDSFDKTLVYTDEYGTSFSETKDEPVSAIDYCIDNNIAELSYNSSYQMMRPGPFIPYNERDKGLPHYRYRREGAGSIEGIEVKLNFLNYINPKDLIIWLEVKTCDQVANALNPPANESGGKPKPRDRWYTGSYRDTMAKFRSLLSPNPSGLKSYLYRLIDMNDNLPLDTTQPLPDYDYPFNNQESMQGADNTYRIYLLNQDHIHNYNNNSSVVFADHQDLSHIDTNRNINQNVIFYPQNISNNINFKIQLPPTLSATGFSDYQSANWKKALMTNNLLNPGHKLERLKGMPIFGSSPQNDTAPGNSSSTTFTLCIAVLNETDDGMPYDRVALNDFVGDTKGIISRNRSNIPNNSLCSWELILHKNRNTLRSTPNDILGDIDYSSKDPYIPGYSFITNLKDKEYLLPPSVLNAPNEYTIGGRLCKYAKEKLNAPTYETRPLNILPLIFLFPFTIIGSLVAITLVDAALEEMTRGIVDWFNNERKQRQKENFDKENYIPGYDKYSTGGSNKLLISMSKDEKIWYKTEASIFKYNNSIVMNDKEYTYYHLHIDSVLKAFCMFSMSKIIVNTTDSDAQKTTKYLRTLVDSKTIKKIFIDISGPNAINLPSLDKLQKDITSTKEKIQKILDAKKQTDQQKKDLEKLQATLNKLESTYNGIGLRIEDGDIVELLEQTTEGNNGLYTILDKYRGEGNNRSDLLMTKLTDINQLLDNSKYIANNNIVDLARHIDLGNIVNFIDKTIIVDGVRPYHFFNNNQNILLFEPKSILTTEEKKTIETRQQQIDDIINAAKAAQQQFYLNDEDKETIRLLENDIWRIRHIEHQNEIKAKGTVLNNNKLKTVFILDKAINDKTNTLSVNEKNSNRIVFFNNTYGTINSENLPFNIWGISDKNVDFDTTVKDSFSAFGEGNYGYGSLVTDPPVLYNQEIKNRIHPFIDEIDITKNSSINIVEAKIINSDNTIENVSSKSNGFGFKFNDMQNIIETYNNIIKITNDNKELSSILSKILADTSNQVYKNDDKVHYCVEIDLQDVSKISDYGKIIFQKDIEPTIIYGFSQKYAEAMRDMQTRIPQIAVKKIEINTDRKQYIDSFNRLPENSRNYNIYYKKLDSYNNDLSILDYELSQIKMYTELCSTDKSQITKIPHISVSYSQDRNSRITFTEQTNDGYYWINIDPEQGCSIDKDKSPKILKEVRYTCQQYNDLNPLDAPQICVPNAAYGGTNGTTTGIDENINTSSAFVSYYLDERLMNKEKAKYPGVSWSTGTVEVTKTFFLNGHGEARNQLILAQYMYIYPVEPNTKDQEPDGSIQNKVMDVFNLDNVNELSVEVKRIPRKLRNTDNIFDKYQPNQFGQLTKSLLPSPGGPIDATLKIWRCLDPNTGAYLKETPLYYKWLNEMIFRCYYGSADRAEFKGKQNTQSKDPTAWVPYDYT